MRCILTDIEGTTTSINFVKEILFPYFKEHLAGYCSSHAGDPFLEAILMEVRATIRQEENRSASNTQAIVKLLEWTDLDRKHGALKRIQGRVWQQGYETKDLSSHVYADVPPALKKWKAEGLTLAVYSSGSVEAQQLIFEHSVYGNLAVYFSHYFDTAVGYKREQRSYGNIREKLNIPAKDILFLSDVEAELDAAHAAGLSTLQLVREEAVPGNRHRAVRSFSEITF